MLNNYLVTKQQETIMQINDIKDAIKNMPEEKVQQLKKDLYLNTKSKGMLDAVQEKIVSRKLLVFGAATALFVSLRVVAPFKFKCHPLSVILV